VLEWIFEGISFDCNSCTYIYNVIRYDWIHDAVNVVSFHEMYFSDVFGIVMYNAF
jgi:hypothetical protein